MIGSRFSICVPTVKNNCSWRAAKQEGRIPWSNGVHAQLCRCLAAFGAARAMDGTCPPAVAIGAIYQTIMGDWHVPDYGLHGVLSVPLCGINGTRDLVVQVRGKQLPLLPEPSCGQFWMIHGLWQKRAPRASLNNEKANKKGKVWMEGAIAVHFMRNERWERVINACLQHPGVQQHQVAGKS